MRLILVQHGEAVDKTVDPERPLSPRGNLDVEGVALALARASVAPQAIVHSGKTRAKQSAEIFQRVLDSKGRAAEITGIGPLDSVSKFAERTREMSADTLVCGHQPFMGRLVSQLLTGDQEVPLVTYSPGSAACLERNGGGSWTLVWFLRPELCREAD